MRKLFLLLTLLLPLHALGQNASAPVIALPTGTYSGVQTGVKITSPNTGTNIIACTIDGATPATDGNGTGASFDGHSFAVRNPGWIPIGGTELLQCVGGTNNKFDSVVTSANYIITPTPTFTADLFGAQCQGNAAGCPLVLVGGVTLPQLPTNFPAHQRTWDQGSPFFNANQAGTNCNWSAIEAVTAGVYDFTCLDKIMATIHDFRNGLNGYTAHPGFVAYFTNGMMPPTHVTPPGPFTNQITGVTAVVGSGAGINNTTTYSGSFGSTSLVGLYVTTSLLNVHTPSNNIGLSATGTGQIAITGPAVWTGTSITVAGNGGTVDTNPQTGTLTIVPGPKGYGILPNDLATWNGTAPIPVIPSGPCAGQVGSCSFNQFFTALVNHCSGLSGRSSQCFYNEYNGIEGWNEPNNQFFCVTSYCSIAGVMEMLEGAIPIARLKMDGTGGTNKVVIQSIATTASAGASSLFEAMESCCGMLSDVFSLHQYWGLSISAAPESVAGNTQTIFNTRNANTNPGWAKTPPRLTELSWQSTGAPYGCSVGNPWTLDDCVGQMVRAHIIFASLGATGLDWYNWNVNIGKVAGYNTAYAYMQQYLIGGTLGACTSTGTSPVQWKCNFVEANGHQALLLWTYCPNDGNYASCAANGQSFVVPTGYTQFFDLNGGVTPVNVGNTITTTVKPIMLDQGTNPNAPAPPSAIFAKIAQTFQYFKNSMFADR